MPGFPFATAYSPTHSTASTGSSQYSGDEVESMPASPAASATSTTQAPRERTFECPEPGCGGRFHRKFTLREHIKTHTGEKPYQCAIKSCGKLFSTSGNLSRHRRLHMLKRIKCPILDCTRIFTKQEKLLRHLKVHMGSAAHACNFPGCTKTFSTSGNLSRHQRTQHRSGSIPSMHAKAYAMQPPAFTKPEMYSTTPIESFQQSLHYRPAYAPVAGPISDNDVMVLLDCLFVNEAARIDPANNASALHSARGFLAHPTPQDSFEVYF